MRTTRFLITGFLCLLFSAQVSLAQNLQTAVSLKVENATLPQVLQQIQQQYGLRFSYLNNEMPANRKFTAQVIKQPLANVLDVLLEQTDFGYQEKQGQIIIKRGFPKNKSKTTTFRPLPPSAPAPGNLPKTAPAAAPGKTKTAETREAAKAKKPKLQPSITASATNPEKTEAESIAQENATPTVPVAGAAPESISYPDQATDGAQASEETMVEAPVAGEEVTTAVYGGGTTTEQKPAFLQKLKAIPLFKTPSLNLTNDKALNKDKADSSVHPDSVAFRMFHVGLMYPLSTNGIYAGRYVNNLSAHVMIGRAAGVEGAEFAGIGNITGGYVRGAQFAGLFNVVFASEKLQELAQARAQGYNLQGGQFAGFMNITAGDFRGGQFAGFLNVGRSGKGMQAAGFLNLAKDLKGAQVAGFTNLAKNTDGAQVAGFLNLAREVDVQVAGFLNVASYMKGAQIGVINLADSASGVPIGLFSLVRKNGYRRVELYYADDFDANFTFKMGVRKFYNLLAVGAELQNPKRWGYGYGIGSEWALARWFRVNTDLISYYVVERSFEDFPRGFSNGNRLNLLNKFRLLGTLQLGNHLALFGGPTFNVMVSEYQEPGSDRIGSTLGTNPFYDKTSTYGTNVSMWIGFNAGLRF